MLIRVKTYDSKGNLIDVFDVKRDDLNLNLLIEQLKDDFKEAVRIVFDIALDQ